MKAKIAVLASGEGFNFEAIVQATRQGGLTAEVVGLLTNRAKIGAIGRAHRLGISHQVISPRIFHARPLWDQAVLRQLKLWHAEWVVLAGFLALIGPEVLAAYPQRIVNSHPALLPKYGGPGMYGEHVHGAVLKAREPESGITIHLIDAVYDRGQILAQEKVKVYPGETVDSLAARIKAVEVSLYPRVLNDLVTGRITTC